MKKSINYLLTVTGVVAVLFLPVFSITANASPMITEYSIPQQYNNNNPSNFSPFSITAGPDGALWFTMTNTSDVFRIDTSGNLSEYPIPSGSPTEITAGPDGALWFTDHANDEIGRISTSGVVSEYSVPTSMTLNPEGITAGPDGALWFTEEGADKIGRVTTAGVFTEYSVPTTNAAPMEITAGPDGALWFTEFSANKIGRITTSGDITEYPLSSGSLPYDIASGPDGALWFTEYGGNNIGRISTSGNISEFPLPSSGAEPYYIVSGSDGALWFSEVGTDVIGHISTVGVIDEYSVPGGGYPAGIALGSDGAVWFTGAQSSYIGRITNPTTAPTITSPLSYSAGMRDPITPSDFTVTTSGTPAATISENGVLPQGISFVDNGDGSANFSGMASGNPMTNGTYPITIIATNGAGSTTQNFTLTITTASSPLAFVSPNTVTESYGVPFTFTVDTQGYPLPSSLHKVEGDGSLPPGVSIAYNGDGTATLSGTPDNTADGPYTFTLAATNASGTVDQVFTMTITKAPIFKNVRAGQNPATVGSTYSLPITATGTAPMILTENGSLPNGLSFADNGSGNATISGTPQPVGGGTYPVSVTATNAYGTSTTSFTLKIDEAPSITSANNATATVGSDFYFPVSSLGYPSPNYTLTGTLPAGVHFYPGPGTFGGTPAAGSEGTYALTITATNSPGTSTQTFTLIVGD